MSRLSPQSGMVLALETSLLALILDRPLNLALLAGAAAGWWLWGGGARHWRLTVLLLALGTWVMVVTQALFYGGVPRTVLMTLLGPERFPFGTPPGLYLYREGFLHGLAQSLRIDTVLLMGAGLLVRYATDELVVGLRALRLPASLAFLCSLALRFVPVMAGEARTIWTAQRLRGLQFFPGSPLNWPAGLARGARAVLLPLLAATVRKSDEIAAALVSRGFSPEEAAPVATSVPSRRERAAWVAGAALLAALLAAQSLTRLYQAGLFARPCLDWLYQAVLDHV